MIVKLGHWFASWFAVGLPETWQPRDFLGNLLCTLVCIARGSTHAMHAKQFSGCGSAAIGRSDFFARPTFQCASRLRTESNTANWMQVGGVTRTVLRGP